MVSAYGGDVVVEMIAGTNGDAMPEADDTLSAYTVEELADELHRRRGLRFVLLWSEDVRSKEESTKQGSPIAVVGHSHSCVIDGFGLATIYLRSDNGTDIPLDDKENDE